jgi:beta-glucosidase
MTFKSNFVWGAATSSYQIEGAASEDGKGTSVWDMMCRKKGAIRGGQNGNIACDHYHRYKEDVRLMKEIGLKAYRMSISWPRVLPEGVGRINDKGLEFYDKLVDELLAAGIVPYITLFHWDFPYALYCRGGWLNPESPQWFAEYTKVLVDLLSDRVSHWMTFNELHSFIGSGHVEGVHAPGDRLGFAQVLLATHHVFLSHGRAVEVIRADSKTKPQIGYAPAADVKVPYTNKNDDIDAARKKMFTCGREYGSNSWLMDPIFLGKYPEDGLQLYGNDVPAYTDSDMQLISAPLDFFGVNIYYGDPTAMSPGKIPVLIDPPPGKPINTFDWPIVPESLYWGPRFLYERYKKPVIITENGLASLDWVALDGKVHDPLRIDFLHRHLLELKRAAEDGIPIDGYFTWSLMDNFEWAHGYEKRFGLIHVDYTTQKRTPKDSAGWYRSVIQANGENL